MRLISNLLVGCIWAVSFALVLGGNSATAAGFREMVAGNVAFGVWYPSDAPTATQRLGPFEVELARDALRALGNTRSFCFPTAIVGFIAITSDSSGAGRCWVCCDCPAT